MREKLTKEPSPLSRRVGHEVGVGELVVFVDGFPEPAIEIRQRIEAVGICRKTGEGQAHGRGRVAGTEQGNALQLRGGLVDEVNGDILPAVRVRPASENDFSADRGLLERSGMLIILHGKRGEDAVDVGIVAAEEVEHALAVFQLRGDLPKQRIRDMCRDQGRGEQNVPVDILDLRDRLPLLICQLPTKDRLFGPSILVISLITWKNSLDTSNVVPSAIVAVCRSWRLKTFRSMCATGTSRASKMVSGHTVTRNEGVL